MEKKPIHEEFEQKVKGLEKAEFNYKQSEKALQESEEKYRLLAENSADVIWTMNMEQQFTYFSPSIMKLRGYSPDEAMQIPFENTCTSESCKKAVAAIMNEIARDSDPGIANDRSRTLELEQICKDGSTVWTEVTTSFLRDKDGSSTGILGITRNITERKQAEEKLKFLSSAVEQSFDGMAIADLEGKLIYINPSWVRMHGYDSGEELVGKHISMFHNAEQLKEVITFNEKLIEAGYNSGEIGHMRKNGIIFPVLMTTSVLYDGEGNPYAFVGLARDITERKQAEENLLRLQKLESLGVLAGGIAHDFNNLLAGIMGNASIALLNKGDQKKQEELLQKVITASEKATNLTQQLLTFAKGGISSTKIASATEVIEESVNLALGQSFQVECKLTLPDDLWLSEIDVGQIGQVFQNLIINANQAMPEGGVIQIRAENVKMTSRNSYNLAPGDFVHILVKDSGIGIPKKHLHKIFDPYFSTKDSKKESGGSGLGLAVSHSVIKKHRGCIYANSKQGEGTVFHIYLPADRDAVLKKESIEESFKATKSLKILVMDDNQIVLDLMKDILGNLGHQFVLSEHGAEAIEKYREAFCSETPFDMIILDLTIPGGMGGVETLAELKKIDPNVKAIISSGYSDQVPNGFSGVLSKPYKIKDLVKVLEEVIMWS